MSNFHIDPARTDTKPSELPLLTMGVEEEFLLVDARTHELVATAEQVLADADGADGTMHIEATRYQVESATPIVHTAQELRTQLLTLRRRFTEAAAAHGCRLVACAAPVLRPLNEPLLLDVPRRHEQSARYGALTESFVYCGGHVHIGSFNMDTAVFVADHIRTWIPALIALSANSPFSDGRDTGHASWRSVIGATWPCSGIPPRLGSAGRYQEALQTLIAFGVIMDAKMVYWDVRPSSLWPTVEVRAPDVSTSVDEAVLQAVLVRALVAAALRAGREGRPAPAVRDEILAVARWRAARDGLEGLAVHPYTAEVIPAYALVDALMDHLHTELQAADLAHVTATLATLRRDGCGAHRQRKAFERRRQFTDVVSYLADATEYHGG